MKEIRIVAALVGVIMSIIVGVVGLIGLISNHSALWADFLWVTWTLFWIGKWAGGAQS